MMKFREICMLRSSLYIAHLPLRNILAPHVSIYIVFFTFQLKIQFIPCQASAFISLVRRGSVILRGISLLGNVLCSQQTTVITPDEFEDFSLQLLVEPVRGANSSTERHNIAAHTLQTIIGGLDRVLCAMYARRPNPDADVLPLDRHHNGGTRGDQVEQESKLNFNSTKWWTTASFSN